MENYLRNSACECRNYADRSTMNLADRLKVKTYWQDGIIYENDTARECKCHKVFRLGGRFDRIANNANLPTYSELQDLNYIGNSDNYNKLRALPRIIKEKELKDILVYVHGANGCQKTTSIAKVMYDIVLDNQSVYYTTYQDLIEAINCNDATVLKDVKNSDWLIVENCFTGETVNFKTVYNTFYNLILHRSKPTILSSELTKDEVLEAKSKAFYQQDQLSRIFYKVDKYCTDLAFNDNVYKLQLTNGKAIDIWSL